MRGGPSRKRRGLLGGILAATFTAFAVALGVTLFTGSRPVTEPAPPAASASESTAAAIPSATESSSLVDFELTVALDPGSQHSEVVTVTSNGRLVGTLQVDTASPTDVLPVNGPAGTIAYELDISMVLLDGSQLSCTGEGSIDASQGTRFAVRVDRIGPGCTALLD